MISDTYYLETNYCVDEWGYLFISYPDGEMYLTNIEG